jgi:GT2 family glycosyltransferase
MPQFACSVVVATYNRSRLLKRLLDSLMSQELGAERFEVVVVDDGSVDDTQVLLSKLSVPYRLTVLRQANQGPAAARNLAIASISSNLVVSLDDDVVATPDLLQRHVEAHRGRPRLAVMGAMLLPPQKRLDPWLEWEAVALKKQYAEMEGGLWNASPRQFYTANASFDRDAAVEAGLFDPSFRRAEDVELAYRLQDEGGSFQFLPEAIVYHEPNRSYADWLRVPLLYGYYDVVMARQKGREYVLDVMANEFQDRQTALRAIAHLLVGRRRILRSFVVAASAIATGATWLQMQRVTHVAYSAIFNLEYWQGICDGLGGRNAFWGRIVEATHD